MTDKHPFAIDVAIARIREAIRPFPRAALFALAEEGFSSPFELLVACIISIRTLDAVTLSCVYRLFAQARTPLAMSQLTPAAIDDAIHACTFEAMRPRNTIACRVVAAYSGYCRVTPDLALVPRVGPKCANLVLGIACQQPSIGVDIHVHRVTNRWGYVSERTPERTMLALEAVLPQRAGWRSTVC